MVGLRDAGRPCGVKSPMATSQRSPTVQLHRENLRRPVPCACIIIHSQPVFLRFCLPNSDAPQPGFIASPYLFNRAALSPIVCRVSPHSLGPALDSFSVLDRAVACMRGRMKAIFFMFKLFDRPICTVRVVLLMDHE